ncbi:hypothetical protein MLD38_005138 [Melastoma candidum]|uniref:Uncharacterized protein n=1 Tax=Melastoma candidum TaxID=119954 RepID=A0ACB9S7X6_9MYRT|nr:hypothetical protein MLD38_005138 [Melastoma candidum]
MSNVVEDYSSDAPEEFTAEQGVKLDQEISKERRRLWAQRKAKEPSENDKVKENPVPPETEDQEDESKSLARRGMLPTEVVNFLATREKRVFLSDSEDKKPEVKPKRRIKKGKGSRPGTVVLSDILPPPCVHSSLEFLKKRKMQVASHAHAVRSFGLSAVVKYHSAAISSGDCSGYADISTIYLNLGK